MVAQQEAIVEENSVVVSVVDDHQERNSAYHNQLQNINKSMLMIKGKRTKRPRPLSPLALTMSSTTTTDEGGSGVSEDWTVAPNSSAVTSLEEEEEEQDMAHCLILLAQGTNNSNNNNNNMSNNDSTSNLNIIKGSNVISSCYECKTCNKTFSSFQALGGHRASHKKPRLNSIATLSELKKSSPVIFSLLNHHDNHHHHHDGTKLSLQISNSSTHSPTNTTNASTTNKTKVHECGICGAEFSSGQALGGHMRRHRPIGTTTSNPNQETSMALSNAILNTKNNVKDQKTTRNLLSLDLNLPAPEDEQQQRGGESSSSKYVFSSNEKTLVFAASSSPRLVDCHY